MFRQSKDKLVHRSGDFTDIDEYTQKDLDEAYRLYRELYRTKDTVMVSDFEKHFKCSAMKARILYAAAEFKRKMEKKGLA